MHAPSIQNAELDAKPQKKEWNPEVVAKWVAGEITLAELEGITQRELYRMAELGYRFLTEGKLKKARDVFQGLAVLDPTDAYFETVLGAIAQRSGDLDEAEAHYSIAIVLNPESATALANRGEVLARLGRLDEAVQDLRLAIEKDPEEAEAATTRARYTLRAVEKRLAALSSSADAASEAATEIARAVTAAPMPQA